MFLDDSESCDIVRVWLAPLFNQTKDSRLVAFQSFTMEGNWSAPKAVTVYADRSPDLSDDGIRIEFR